MPCVQELRIRSDIDVSCFEYEGVEAVKAALVRLAALWKVFAGLALHVFPMCAAMCSRLIPCLFRLYPMPLLHHVLNSWRVARLAPRRSRFRCVCF